MNKRENAIWKLVVFLGLLILVLNIFSVIGNNEELVSSINGTDCNLESKNGCGIINYFYEFAKYPGSLSEKDEDMINIIESYGVDSDEILSQSRKTGLNKEALVADNAYRIIEIHSSGKRSKRESTVYGFSIADKKIKGGEYFLTEIKGSPGEKCKNKLRLKNAVFKNDEVEIGTSLNFKQSKEELECNDGRAIGDVNSLYLTDSGEIWYNSTSSINSFEFKIEGAKILNILSGLDPNVFDNFIILNTDEDIVGFSKTDFSIPSGCGMLLKLDLDSKSFSLTDIKLSNNGSFYNLNTLRKYNSYNDSILHHVNYFYSKLNSDNNVEIYIKTEDEVDEYSFDISCFECEIQENVILSELEISRAKTKERDFYFSMNTNDPSDLTNIVMFEGQDGYNQGRQKRAVVPTGLINEQNASGETEGLVEYQDRTHTIKLGDIIGDFKIIEMNRDYFLGSNIKTNSLDTLKYKNGQ